MYEYKGKIKREFIDRALKYLARYKADKEALKKRIIFNERWYKANYSQKLDPNTNETKPASSYIFSAIENKYADAVDNYPSPNIIEREEDDEETAKLLTKIIPTELDIAGFKRIYKDNARRKLKHGTAIYGVFYNSDSNALQITSVDILNIYCDMHLKDVQDSQFLFIISCIDNDILKEDYPECAELFEGSASIESYSGSYELEDKTEVIDCYYKKPDGSMHLMKLVGDKVIDATEDTEGYEGGLYEHGRYPVVFDIMYPEDDCPFGFGITDVVRNIQEYIDKLDGAIIKNTLLQAETRYIVKDNSGLKVEDLLDCTKNVVQASGDISEDAIRQLKYEGISAHTLNHRETKKNEIKEIIGNRDFQQGGTANGVIAASAITALQAAGEKISRAMCDDSYEAYKQIIIQAIELMREFYNEEKIFRITNENGIKEYKGFSNTALNKRGVDALGFPTGEYSRAEFDIEIVPQRENPFSKEANNQTMMTLWNSGVMIADNIRSGASSIIIQAMNFDGKEKLLRLIEGYREQLEEQAQQMQAQQMPHKGEELTAIDTRTGEVIGELSAEGEDEVIPIDLNQMGGDEI